MILPLLELVGLCGGEGTRGAQIEDIPLPTRQLHPSAVDHTTQLLCHHHHHSLRECLGHWLVVGDREEGRRSQTVCLRSKMYDRMGDHDWSSLSLSLAFLISEIMRQAWREWLRAS